MGKVHLRLTVDLHYDGVPDEHRETCVNKLVELAEATAHRADDDGMFTSDTIMELQKYDAEAKEVTTAHDERTCKIIQMAQDAHDKEGTCEVDDEAILSEGDDNGSYVQAWVWVSFKGTELDKEKKPEDARAPHCNPEWSPLPGDREDNQPAHHSRAGSSSNR